MAPAIDSISGLFTAIDVTPPAPSTTADYAAGGFADHLQQASQSTAPKASTPGAKPQSHDNNSAKDNTASSPDAASTAPKPKSQANSKESAKSSSGTDDKAQIDQARDVEPADKDEESTVTDPLATVLKAAQVLVPDVIVQPQAEIAVHTEVAVAQELADVTQLESTDTAAQAAAVDALPQVPDSDKTVKPAEVPLVNVDEKGAVEIVAPRKEQHSQHESSQQQATPVEVDSQAAVDAVELTATQIEQVKQQVASEATPTDSRAEVDRAADDPKSAVNNDAVQVSTTTNPSTATTVVAAIPTTSNDGRGDTDSRGKQQRDSVESIANRDSNANGASPTNPDVVGSRPPRLAIEKLTAGAAATDGKSTLTEAERVRFVQRVAKAVHTAVENGGPIRLRLSPPELGSVRIEMRVVEGQMSVRVETETSQARTALLDNLPVLRERLEQQEIKITKFDVDLFGGSGSQPQNPQGNLSQDAPLPRHQLRRDAPATATSEATLTPARAAIAADGRLNVVI